MSKKMDMTIKTLKELIEESKLSYREVALRVGTTHDMVVRWTKPNADLKVSNYIKLAKVLGVSLKTLAASIGQQVEDIPDDCGGEDEDI